jgi:GLEYA domain
MKDPTCGGDGATLYSTGITTSIGGINVDCSATDITVYGGPTSFPCKFFSLDHRGYLFAPLTGTYTFTISGVDDIVFIWVGPFAQAAWTRSNANFVIEYGQSPSNSGGPGAGSFTMVATQGDYVPLRIIFGQAQGPAVFQISLTDPNGNILLNSNTLGSPYLVQYSCDGILAPQFVGAFGNEC